MSVEARRGRHRTRKRKKRKKKKRKGKEIRLEVWGKGGRRRDK